MPLSPPSPRQRLHDRIVECRGFRRDDGLWDIEGRMVDTKTYAFPNHDRGEIKAGEPLHEMWIRLTIDDDFLIHSVEACTEHGPFHVCGAVAADFSALAGLRIGKGFLREVRTRFAGVRGCTHLIELFGPLATTAYQTLFTVRESRAATELTRPKVIDTCHALAADGEAVRRQWPAFYAKAKLPEAAPGD